MLLDLEILLVKTFSWSLHELDETDTVSVFDFVNRINATNGEVGTAIFRTYCDQVGWM